MGKIISGGGLALVMSIWCSVGCGGAVEGGQDEVGEVGEDLFGCVSESRVALRSSHGSNRSERRDVLGHADQPQSGPFGGALPV
jgi:hypothetical protein